MQQAKRFNEGKPELAEIMLFDTALDDLAAVMTQGGIKYDDTDSPVRNWTLGGRSDKDYLNSALRHIKKFVCGHQYDEDLGTKHAALAAWNLLALLRLNDPDSPPIDPDFDQAAFVARYATPAGELDGVNDFLVADFVPCQPIVGKSYKAALDDLTQQHGAETGPLVVSRAMRKWYEAARAAERTAAAEAEDEEIRTENAGWYAKGYDDGISGMSPVYTRGRGHTSYHLGYRKGKGVRRWSLYGEAAE